MLFVLAWCPGIVSVPRVCFDGPCACRVWSSDLCIRRLFADSPFHFALVNLLHYFRAACVALTLACWHPSVTGIVPFLDAFTQGCLSAARQPLTHRYGTYGFAIDHLNGVFVCGETPTARVASPSRPVCLSSNFGSLNFFVFVAAAAVIVFAVSLPHPSSATSQEGEDVLPGSLTYRTYGYLMVAYAVEKQWGAALELALVRTSVAAEAVACRNENGRTPPPLKYARLLNSRRKGATSDDRKGCRV